MTAATTWVLTRAERRLEGLDIAKGETVEAQPCRFLSEVGITRGETVAAKRAREEMYAESCRASGDHREGQKRQERLEAQSRGRGAPKHRRGGERVSELLLWALSCILFLVAVACAVFGTLVGGGEHRYLFLSAWVAWAVLCLALGVVIRAVLL